MKRRSKEPEDPDKLREKIIGLGERSVRKSYYPKLQKQLHELERTKERLKELTRRQELILEYAGEGIFGLDLAGNYTFMNRAAAAMLGYKPEDLIGKHSHSCVHYLRPDRAPYPEEECRTYTAYRSGVVRHSEDECFCRKDGTRFPVEYTSTPIKENGEITGAVVTFRDITERKRAEEALRTSEENYRSIFESANDAIFVHDIETGEVISINKKNTEMFGHSLSQLRNFGNQALFIDVPGYTAPDAMQWLRRAADGPPQIFEWLSKRKNGELFWVEVNLKRAIIGGKQRLMSIVRDISERKRAEEALRESEWRLEFATSLANEAIWDWDLVADRITRNAVYDRMFGRPAEAAAAAEWWRSRIHPEDRDRVAAAFADVIEGRQDDLNVEYRFLLADGSWGTVHDRAKVIRDSRGRPVRIVGTMLNITERKQVENRIRESEANVRTVLDSVYDAVFIHNLDGTIIDVNKKMLELYRVDREQALRSRIIEDFSAPDNPFEKVSDLWNKAIEGEDQLFEWKAKRPGDGSVFDVEVFLRKITFREKEVILASVRDITDRKKAEEMKARLSAIVETAEDAIISENLDGVIQTWNKGAEKIYGYAAGEITGKSFFLLTPPDRTGEFREILAKISRGDHLDHYETELLRKDGSRFHVSISVSPIQDERGRVTGGAIIAHDITERIRTENELTNSYNLTKTILDSVNDAISLIDVRDFTIVSVNKAFLKTYGYAGESEIAGKYCYAITHRRTGVCSPPDDICPLIESVKSKEHFAVDHVHYDRQGRKIYVEVSTSPIRDRAGNVIQVVHVQRDITERKRAEEELRISESRFRNLFKQSSLSMQILSPEGRTLEVNHAFEELWGLKLDALKDYNIREDEQLIAKGIMPYIQKGFAGEAAEIPITRYAPSEIDRFGQARWVKAFIYPVKTADGRIHQAVLMHWDVTEMATAQEALRESEERFRAFFELAAVGAVEADPLTGRYLRVNDRYCKIMGYSREELLSKTISELTHPDDREMDSEFFNAIRTGELREYGAEKRYAHKDGHTIWGQVSVAIIRDSRGVPVRTAAILQDITARKHAEEALRESENRFRAFFESAGVGTVQLDPATGRFINVNERFCRITGYSRDELRLMTFSELTHAEDRLTAEQYAEAVRPGAPVFETEKRYVRKDGKIVWVHISATVVHDAAGKPIHTAGIVQDITDRKHAEDALRRSEEFLRRVLDNLIAFVGVLTSNGVLIQVNRSALEAAGIGAGDVLGKKFEETYWFTRSPHAQALLREAMRKGAAGEVSRFDMEVRVAGGGLMPIDFMLAPIMDEQGRVTHLLPSAIDITERKRMEDDIKHMAHHDALTGLPNRRLFRDIIGLELAQARRNRKKFAILFLDLDRFKEINDALGHSIGDRLLKEVSVRFRESIRKSDTVARIGGDEFNIVLADLARSEDAREIASKIVKSLREPIVVDGHELHITTSVGISVYPEDSEEIDSLLQFADMAMYHAKESGRNTFTFYNPSINVSSLERMKLENWLRQTIRRGELFVQYQPQVEIRSRRIAYAEALVRWNHPDRGPLPPQEFIPLAEETGFITDIDEWVLRTVCAQARSWKDAGLYSFCVTVNLSARQFQCPDLVGRISAILRETGMEPGCLNIEVTETTAMSNIERTASQLRELSGMGVHISIDDFGTGYSSLNYLKKLPIERLKIDKSFIRDIAKSPDDRAIIGAVTSMARKMGIKTVAEGVETEEQLEFLRSSGCDEAQGFLFSPPLPPEEFSELVKSRRTG